MFFHHADNIWADFPELVPGALRAEGMIRDGGVEAAIERFNTIAENRLASRSEGELPEIQAWRRAFSRMGLKPTQYRCASEALLRRFRQERSLPRIHPLIDLCNAASLAFAIPIAVFDVAQVAGGLQVRRATGNEAYETFAGETENPERGEVIFADEAGRAHARRWTNRQSGLSAVCDGTTSVLIVAEGMHADAPADVAALLRALADELDAAWSCKPVFGMLSRSSPPFSSDDTASSPCLALLVLTVDARCRIIFGIWRLAIVEIEIAACRSGDRDAPRLSKHIRFNRPEALAEAPVSKKESFHDE